MSTKIEIQNPYDSRTLIVHVDLEDTDSVCIEVNNANGKNILQPMDVMIDSFINIVAFLTQHRENRRNSQ